MPTRAETVLVGAVALALGALALALERCPAREAGRVAANPAEPSARDARAREASTTVDPVARGREHAARDEPEAPARGPALRVDVVDSGGRPAAGVPLACGLVSASDPERFDERLRAHTDAGGTAWIELDRLAPDAGARPAGSLRLRAVILAHPVPELALDPATLAAGHAVLRLPPTGSVRLELAGATPAAVRFALWARPADAARELEPLPRVLAAPDGVARLEHVGLGLELAVAAESDGGETRAERIRAPGPRCAGDALTLAVPLGAEWPVVRVRARDEHGRVLAHEPLEVAVSWSRPGADTRFGPDAGPPRALRTDAEGRLRVPLRGSVAGGYTRRLVLTHGAGARAAERELSFDLAPGSELDLGDVELRPPERRADVPWVSGIVADSSGSPVPGATLLVTALDAAGAPVPGAARPAVAAPDGRFAVRGPPLAQPLAVRALAPGFLPSVADVVAPGTSALRVSLAPAARWTGRLRLDPDIPPESLVVEVLTPAGGRRTLLASERIALDGLDADRVDVEVRTRTGAWLVERWEGLATAPGTAPEPREHELDLRGRLTRVRLRLAEPDGTPLERVFARIQPDTLPEGGAWIRAGRLELVVPSSARRLRIRPRGYAPLAAEPRDGLQELTCDAGIPAGA